MIASKEVILWGFLIVEKNIFNDKWQLMLDIGHHMFVVIDITKKFIIMSFERR